MIHRYLAHEAVWGAQNGATAPISGGFQGPCWAEISYATGVTCQLTGQGRKWEPMIK